MFGPHGCILLASLLGFLKISSLSGEEFYSASFPFDSWSQKGNLLTQIQSQHRKQTQKPKTDSHEITQKRSERQAKPVQKIIHMSAVWKEAWHITCQKIKKETIKPPPVKQAGVFDCIKASGEWERGYW